MALPQSYLHGMSKLCICGYRAISCDLQQGLFFNFSKEEEKKKGGILKVMLKDPGQMSSFFYRPTSSNMVLYSTIIPEITFEKWRSFKAREFISLYTSLTKQLI
ncbi:unnamed protein product [Ilex paraguariensis]|uniref:Uncharacterized protein n=1 Tax=Ilex paraguariensis TaxID=185542 RepID=A0ABC8R219_9AQUA